MQMDKWCNRTTAKFIEVYRYHQCLWNVKHGLYKDREARDAAYSNIIYEMARSQNVHMTVKAVREKIRSLRNTFINEIKKIEEAKYMGTGVYTPRLKWFESMKFLRQNDEDVKCVGQSTISHTENSITITKVPENESITITRLSDAESFANNYVDNAPELHIMEPVVNLTEVSNGHHRPIQPETHVHSLTLPFATNAEHLRNTPKIIEEDEFDAFGRNVALQLKNLPLIYALDSQEIIQRVLKEQRIKALQGPLNHTRDEGTNTTRTNTPVTTITFNSEMVPMFGTTVKVEAQ